MADPVMDRYRAAEKLKDAGQLEPAVKELQAILQDEPNHVLSHLALAVLYGRLGRHEDAVASGRRACEIDPHDPFHFTALSVTCQRAWQGTQDQQYIQLAEEAMAHSRMLEANP